MNPLMILELLLRIFLRILETTPDDVLAEQSRNNWDNFKKFLEWCEKLGLDKMLKIDQPPQG